MSKRRDGGLGKGSLGTGSSARRGSSDRRSSAARGASTRDGLPEWVHKRAGGRTPMGAKASARPASPDAQRGTSRDGAQRERVAPKFGRGRTPAVAPEHGGWSDRPIREAGPGVRSGPSGRSGPGVRSGPSGRTGQSGRSGPSGRTGQSGRSGPSGRYAPGGAAVHKGARGREDAQSFRERESHGAVAERGQRQPSARGEADIQAEFVAGRRAVLEALRSDRALNKLLVQDDVSGGSVGELLGIARAKGVVIQRVPRARLDEIAQSRGHQGVLAYTAAHPYADLEQLLESVPKGKPGLLVVLDGIEDPHNLGSILRSAECAGAHGVIIPKRRSVALTGAVAKASAGAIEYIPVARVGNVNQVLKTLRELGYWVVGADPDGTSLYDELDYGAPTAFVIGGEGRGLSALTAKSCDALVRLPMQGHIASLNAGVAAGVLLFEAIRQRRSV